MKLVNLALNLGAIAAFFGATLILQWPQLNQTIVGQTIEADLKALEQEKRQLSFFRQIPPSGLGFNNLIANLIFLRYLQYFGDDIAREEHKTGYSLAPEYFEAIVDRDPKFIYSYLFISTGVSIYAARPDKAIELYERGLKSLKPEQLADAYLLWRYKAIDSLLFLGQTQIARQSYQKAAEWIDRAVFKDEESRQVASTIAVESRKSAQYLLTDPDSKSARINAWNAVLAVAVDRKTLQIAINELSKLDVDVMIDQDGKPVMVPRDKPKSNFKAK